MIPAPGFEKTIVFPAPTVVSLPIPNASFGSKYNSVLVFKILVVLIAPTLIKNDLESWKSFTFPV